MDISGLQQIVGLAITDRPYTEDDKQVIRKFVERPEAVAAAVREYVVANPISHDLKEIRERQYRPGHDPAPEVTVYHVVVGGARAGQVQERDGKWLGYYYDDAPGVITIGNARHPRRDTQADAVIDVLADYVRYRGR